MTVEPPKSPRGRPPQERHGIHHRADMMLALTSFDVVETLLAARGWSPAQVAEHLSCLFRATFVAGVTGPAGG
jgi:hypothetical protein